MSETKTLFKQLFHYFTGRSIMMAAGLISFPIITRIFSVSDYGILSLINVTLFIVLTITKLGHTHSVVRFYSEFESNNGLAKFYSTIFAGYATSGLIIAILFWLVLQLMPEQFLDQNISNLLSLVSILIFIKCISSIITSFFRAAQRTKLYNIIMITSRYTSLALSIFFVFFIIRGLYGFYCGQIISDLIMSVLLLYIIFKKQRISFASFSPPFFKKSFKFGFPLVWSELGHLILSYSDRYLIQYYLGSTLLGIYTAGYNLTMYVTDIIIYPFYFAMEPVYISIFNKKGEEETAIFLSKALRYFMLIILPVTFGFIAVGKDLIAVLASSKYIEAYKIIPYVIIGNAIYACQGILNSGLFIRQKTYILMLIKIGACILNLALNILLIPRYGILGAAQATLISYIVYTLVITYYSFKQFRFRIDYPNILLYLTASLTMYLIIKNINLGSHAFNLITKVGTGILVYSSLVILLDRDIRRKTVGLIKDLL